MAMPYEVTVNDAMCVAWQSVFFSQDRINSSNMFAKSLGLTSSVMPFSLMHFLCGSMSHIDETQKVMEVSNRNAVYLEPCYAGDTLRKVFTIRGLHGTQDNKV